MACCQCLNVSIPNHAIAFFIDPMVTSIGLFFRAAWLAVAALNGSAAPAPSEPSLARAIQNSDNIDHSVRQRQLPFNVDLFVYRNPAGASLRSTDTICLLSSVSIYASFRPPCTSANFEYKAEVRLFTAAHNPLPRPWVDKRNIGCGSKGLRRHYSKPTQP